MDAFLGTNSDDSITIIDDGTVVAQGGDDIICDAGDGGNHVIGGTGDDTFVYTYSADRSESEYLGGSGVDSLIVQITQSEYEAIKDALDAEIAAYRDFLDGVIKNSGEATGQWFEFTTLNLTAKQLEDFQLVIIPDAATDLGSTDNSDTGTGLNGQDITATIETQAATFDGTADAEITVSFGEPVQPEVNVVFTFDTSGSTQNQVPGATVGDLNSDGRFHTILDVEIAALNALAADIASQGFADGAVSISLVAFDENATVLGTIVLDDTDGTTISDDLAAISLRLSGEDPGGRTSYVNALTATDFVLDGLDPDGTDTNLVYFLSDGTPNPLSTQTIPTLEFQAAQVDATISAVGIGTSVDPRYLDAIDSFGGADIVSDPNDLVGTLLADPVSSALIVDAFVFVTDADGVVSQYGLDASDFEADALGLTLSTTLEDIAGLSVGLDDSSTVTLQVNVDSDGDGSVDTMLETSVDVTGLYPDLIC